MILVCVASTVGIIYLQDIISKKHENIKLTKYILCNILISCSAYLYYFGYTVSDIKSLIVPTCQSLFLLPISLLVAVGACVLSKMKFKQVKITYNLEKLDKYALVMILLLSVLVRIVGYNWGGNGVSFQGDEGKVYSPAVNMAENNTMMSDEINYPSHTTQKVLSIVFKTMQILEPVFHIEFRGINYLYVTRIYIAIVSVLIVGCIFFIGNHIRKHAGTVAATLAAVFPPFVQAAHNATGDPLVALCICLAILLSFYYFESESSYRELLCLSFIAAVATLEKYHGAVICGLIAINIISKYYKNKRFNIMSILKEGIFSFSVYCVCLFLISPNLVIRFPKVWEQLHHLTDDYGVSHTFAGNLNDYTFWFLSHAGILCAFFAIYGSYIILKRKQKENLALTIGVIEIIGICMQNRSFIRWGYPFYLILLIASGVGIVEFVAYLYGRKKKMEMVLSYLSISIIFINNLAGTIFVDVLFAKSWTQDVRNASKNWCESKGISSFDCIYDMDTCWHAVGCNNTYVEWNHVDTSLVEEEGKLLVKVLGRDYAVANHELKEFPLKYPKEIKEVYRLEAEYEAGGALLAHNDFSLKIFEPINIMNIMNMCARLIQEEMYTGLNTYIYDISKIPAYEEFKSVEMDIDSDTDGFTGDLVLSSWIVNIKQGIYEVDITGSDSEGIKLAFEDKEGNIITPNYMRDNKALFELEKDYLQELKIKVYILSEDEGFEKIVIKEAIKNI